MEPKQKECFCPVTIEKWNLASVSKYAREAWEFVNLYSRDRGCNRFLALLKAFDWLRERPEVKRRGTQIPKLPDLRVWTEKETELGNPALKDEILRTASKELEQVLDWSLAINEAVARVVREVPPFPLVRESLVKLASRADTIVVSSTPDKALFREWEENNIARYVAIIAGQEMGSKKEHLQLVTDCKYDPAHVLMIGDAPGDLRAARAAGARFYPIIPGDEEAFWQRFHDDIIDAFLGERYTETLEEELLTRFEQALPAMPTWA
ncbi:MAG: HAD hydrolase-like protein [Planctomycetes bacterium]|nr:HAD hydrolase-like protein [Planctomycetota bacterium]